MNDSKNLNLESLQGVGWEREQRGKQLKIAEPIYALLLVVGIEVSIDAVLVIELKFAKAFYLRKILLLAPLHYTSATNLRSH